MALTLKIGGNMKNSKNQCSAVYEPLGFQCVKPAHHKDSHACYHNGDIHLWRDLSDLNLIQGAFGQDKTQEVESETPAIACSIA